MKKISLILFFICVFNHAFSQITSARIEYLYGGWNNRLYEETHYEFDPYGKLLRQWEKSYRNEISITTMDYFHDTQGRVARYMYSGKRSFIDSLKKEVWLSPIPIFTNDFYYDDLGRLIKIDECSFQCNFNKYDSHYYFYDNKRLILQTDTHKCTNNNQDYWYSTKYKYDSNDSIIWEQATWPCDTNKIWWTYTWDYTQMPKSYVYESYYRNNDTLGRETKYQIVFNDDHFITQKIFMKENQTNDTIFYDRSKTGLLIKETYKQGDKIRYIVTHKYNSNGQIVLKKKYNLDFKTNKVKLYEYFKYKYVRIKID